MAGPAGGAGRPARRVVNGRRVRDTGRVPTHKAVRNGQVAWESPLEADLIVVEEFEPRTTSIEDQPHTLYAWTEGREFRHTPDFLLERRPGDGNPEVVEVKPTDLSQEPEIEEMLGISGACHRAMGFEFSVRGQEEIRAEPRLWNCRLLRRYRLTAVRQGLGHTVATMLGRAGSPLTVRDFVAALDSDPFTRFELYALACAGILRFDLAVPLSPMTLIVACELPASGRGIRGLDAR